MTPKAFQRKQAKQESLTPMNLIDSEDFTTLVEVASTDQELLVLTRSGKAYTVNLGAIPVTPRQSKGTPVVSLLPSTATVQGNPEAIVTQFVLYPDDLETLDLVMLTKQGRIKRLPLAEFTNLTGRGLTALKLKEDDELLYATLAATGEQLVLATTGGRVLRFEINDEQVPIMGRAAQGQQALRLHKKEELVGCIALSDEDSLLMLTAQGYGKQVPLRQIKALNRGELGVQAMAFATKSDMLIGIAPGLAGEVMLLTDTPRMVRLLADQVPPKGRAEAGDRLFKLNKGESITGLITVALPDTATEEETETSGAVER
ncbi:MAG TPA: DNA gyrase C-terminal beta-propeller domain-containing protein, partial [Allocoleopsis sp.]